MEALRDVFSYFVDPEKPVGHKASVIISAIVIVLFMDNIMGFSYFYRSSQKIEQLVELEKMKGEYKSDTALVRKLTVLENEIIQRRTVVQQLFGMIGLINLNDYLGSDFENGPVKVKNGKLSIDPLEVFTKSFWFIIASILYPITISLSRRLTITQKIVLSILSEALILFVIAANLLYLELIPLPTLNNEERYLANFIIHTASIVAAIGVVLELKRPSSPGDRESRIYKRFASVIGEIRNRALRERRNRPNDPNPNE